MHFSKAELPPVGAFWSITIYDAQGFQAASPINRFAIGDRDDLKIQRRRLAGHLYPACIPPTAPLGVTMRLYAPKPEVLDGRWNPPAIKRLQ